ncbi:MAG TPA: hypothetical protein VI248_29910 [Kineosporiaceae bacterium]
MAGAGAIEWVQLDGFGMITGKPFRGTAAELRAHLLADQPDGAVQGPVLTPVYIRSLVAKVPCPLITLTTPWGTTRWIPRPGNPRRRLSDHLLL